MPKNRVGWYNEKKAVRDGLPEEAMVAFMADLRRLVAKHFLKDEDGDYPVDVSVVDRTKYERAHFESIQHTHKGSPAERLKRSEAAVYAAAQNVDVAAEQLRRHMRLWGYEKRDAGSVG